QVVASPRPKGIEEIPVIQQLLAANQTVIACGGGGIPVVRDGHHLKGVPAVIDKDFCSALLADLVDADMLIILTAVEKVYLNFGKPDQEALGNVSVARMTQLIEEGHFGAGSMLPKVEAAM